MVLEIHKIVKDKPIGLTHRMTNKISPGLPRLLVNGFFRRDSPCLTDGKSKMSAVYRFLAHL
jgi:hypothetical protein